MRWCWDWDGVCGTGERSMMGVGGGGVAVVWSSISSWAW